MKGKQNNSNKRLFLFNPFEEEGLFKNANLEMELGALYIIYKV